MVINIIRSDIISGLQLEIQRGTAIIKRGSLWKRVNGFGSLGHPRPFKKGNHTAATFSTGHPKRYQDQNGKETYFFCLMCVII